MASDNVGIFILFEVPENIKF